MKILVATDGSKPAMHAVKYAVKLLGSLSSTGNAVTLINVHEDVGLRYAETFVGRETVADHLRELSEKELRPTRKVLDAAGVKHDTEVRVGHVASEIVRRAKAGKFDLLALGAKGRGAVADLLLGSVSQRVLATAQLPVVLIR